MCQKIFLSKMLSWQQSQEEGFYPQIPLIVERQKQQSSKEQKRPKDYKPYQLNTIKQLKKLPTPMLESFTSIPVIQTSEEYLNLLQKYQPYKISERESTPSEKYIKHPEKYRLIYQKYPNSTLKKEKETFTGTFETMTERFCLLPNLLHYQETQYMPLKETELEDFEIPSNQTCVQFDSHFQNGNLFCVFKSLPEENLYHCLIENDTNSNGYNQWFYFSLKGVKKQTLYRFVIPNMRKRYSFFKKGMKPIIFSSKKLRRRGSGWFRRGYNIRYQKSDLFFIKDNQKHSYYSLYFELDFDDDDDFITISFGAPYTYSRLIYQLGKCQEQADAKEVYFKIKTIDYTLSNNQVPQVIITDHLEDEMRTSQLKKHRLEQEWKGSPYSRKKIIVILARQHPCEVNSSFLVQEILMALSKKNNYKITWLLDHFQFRIFPMVNVDGVIYGNTRTDLAGFDLNRTWKRPIKELFPQIHSIKKEIINLHKYNRIAYCLDLHSHSKNYNVFSYGFQSEGATSFLFSHIMNKLSRHFDFSLSRFKPHSYEQKTARAVLASKIGLTKVLTIESSYFGFKKEEFIVFEPQIFQQIAKGILGTLSSYFRNDRVKKQSQKQIETDLDSFRKQTEQSNRGDSDSDPQGDDLVLERKLDILVNSQLTKRRIFQRIKQPSDTQEEESKQKDNMKFQRYLRGQKKSITKIKSKRFSTDIDKRNGISLKDKNNRSQQSMKNIQTQKHQSQQDSLKKSSQCQSNFGVLKRQLARLKKTKTDFGREGLQVSREEEKEYKLEAQRVQNFGDQHFQKQMKQLYKNLRTDKRDIYLRNFRIKRDNQFFIKNSNADKIHHPNPNLDNRYKLFHIKIKTPGIKSLLLSEDKGSQNPLTIKSEEYRYDEGQKLQQTTILERNFEEELKRLKLQYSERADAKLSIFNKLLKNSERFSLPK